MGEHIQLLNPQSIRFSQASIKVTFRDGTSIDDLANEGRGGVGGAGKKDSNP